MNVFSSKSLGGGRYGHPAAELAATMIDACSEVLPLVVRMIDCLLRIAISASALLRCPARHKLSVITLLF